MFVCKLMYISSQFLMKIGSGDTLTKDSFEIRQKASAWLVVLGILQPYGDFKVVRREQRINRRGCNVLTVEVESQDSEFYINI